MGRLTNIFLKGLVTSLPAALTIYAVYWMVTGAESILGRGIKMLLPKDMYIPGLGVAAGVALIFCLGVLMNLWLFRRLVEFGESIFARIPLVKTIYNGIRDMTDFLAKDPKEKAQGGTVVVADFGESRKLIGFIMRKDCSTLPDGLGGEDVVAVYFPLSYQVGGYTFFMPRDKVTPIDMDMEQAMRFALTAGIGKK